MENLATTLKDQVKNIFKTNSYETAMELTKGMYLDYLREYGLKSWNALASYYSKANIQPEEIQVAESETEYSETKEHDSQESMDSVEAQVEEIASESTDEVEVSEEEERVEYMLYQNDGENVSWYSHFVNYKGLKVGESGMMVRMDNLRVGRGKVLATASMTMEEIEMFHKCYAAIRQSTLSDNKRVELFTKAFNNLQSAMRDPKFATLSKGKEIADFVLNYKNED